MKASGLALNGMWAAAVAACGLPALGCAREKRDFRPAPPFTGGVLFTKEYEDNAYALSEGKRLYAAFNCSACHAEGGGGIGPALMDEKWIYGFEPDKIFESISKGRPSGMPSFGGSAGEPGIKVVGTLPEHQRWQLVAYVRSLSGLGSKNAASGRDDHMQRKEPENSIEAKTPILAPPADVGSKPK